MCWQQIKDILGFIYAWFVFIKIAFCLLICVTSLSKTTKLLFFSEPTPGADQRRLFPEEEIRQSYSIVCKQVPKQALVSKKILEKHFSSFGKVNKVVVSSAKEMAIVHFENHDSAKNAKENGLAITPNLSIGAIFFGKSGKNKTRPV